MEKLVITPGAALKGDVRIDGAKNAVSKIMVAAMLGQTPSVIHNVPDISETRTVADMLTDLGATVTFDNGSVTIEPTIATTSVSQRYGGVNRIPILLLSVLAARCGAASVPLSGGCAIGARSIDFHTDGLRRLGADIKQAELAITATVRRFVGATITLDYPSVGATENLMLAGVLAKGTTCIENAAMEPEIVDLALYLQKMGAHIKIDTNRRIIIEGVSQLRGCQHTVIADRIEAASYACAAMATRGEVFLAGARQEHMMTFLNTARKMGAEFSVYDDGILVTQARPLRATHVESDTYPGFATDWIQPLVACMPLADGISVVHETVYENRFGFVCALRDAGAHIYTTSSCLGSRTCRFAQRDYPHSLTVGNSSYQAGLQLDIPDLRGGFAYVIAALAAPERSVLGGLHYLDRGYANVAAKLAGLGADIERTTVS